MTVSKENKREERLSISEFLIFLFIPLYYNPTGPFKVQNRLKSYQEQGFTRKYKSGQLARKIGFALYGTLIVLSVYVGLNFPYLHG